MKTAKFIKKLEGWHGDARLYRLSEAVHAGAIGYTQYVIVSAVDLRTRFDGELEHAYRVLPFLSTREALETYIFPADKYGDVLEWSELEGSFRGGLNHEAALKGMGFSLVDKLKLLLP